MREKEEGKEKEREGGRKEEWEREGERKMGSGRGKMEEKIRKRENPKMKDTISSHLTALFQN